MLVKQDDMHGGMGTTERNGHGPLTYVFVREFVAQSDSLWLMLDGTTVNDGMLEGLNDRFVDRIALSSG